MEDPHPFKGEIRGGVHPTPSPRKSPKFGGARIGPESVPWARSHDLASNGAKIIQIRPILTLFMISFGPGITRGKFPNSRFSIFPIIPAPGVVLDRRGVNNEYENPNFRPQRPKRGPIFWGGSDVLDPKPTFCSATFHAREARS